MSEGSDEATPPNAEGQMQAPAWLRATTADLRDLDFEVPIVGSTAAESDELSPVFRAAAQSGGESSEHTETPASRVFLMLSAVTEMYFKPAERHEPFGPMFVMGGKRSAILADFRGEPAATLAEMAARSTNPVLRARLADVCWLLDRKRANLASVAVGAYVEIVQKIDSGELKLRFASEGGALQFNCRDYLRRTLHIGRAIGTDKAETLAARELLISLRRRAVKNHLLIPVLWFSELDLEFGISDPAEVGANIDEVLLAPPSDAFSHIIVDLWRLAANAYRIARRDEDRYRCLSEAAERLVSDARAANSALLASHTLSAAIAQLHGIPNKKDRRLALRHQLVDIQTRIPDEMSVFTQEMDLKELAEKIVAAVEKAGLLDKLFVLASLARSPDPDELVKAATDAIRQHPLSSMFATSHLDSEGKVVHRSAGASADQDAGGDSIPRQIAQSESIR